MGFIVTFSSMYTMYFDDVYSSPPITFSHLFFLLLLVLFLFPNSPLSTFMSFYLYFTRERKHAIFDFLSLAYFT
jgi:hypothetical protein